MSEKKYFVTRDGTSNIGPFEFSKILDLVNARQLNVLDKIYLAESDQWIKISEHPEFHAKTSSNPKAESNQGQKSEVPAPVSAPAANTVNSNQWFLLRGKEKRGPFGYLEVVKMLQQKFIFKYEFAWQQGMPDWLRLAEIPEFSAEKIKELTHSKGIKKEEVFEKRKPSRILYKCDIVTHNNRVCWPGQTIELSEGGASAVIKNALLLPGQNIYVHFRAGPKTQPFNVLCEIVSKKFEKNLRDRNAPLVYGIKFVNIPKQEKDLIKKIIDEAA